jgi:hypothetical protein
MADERKNGAKKSQDNSQRKEMTDKRAKKTEKAVQEPTKDYNGLAQPQRNIPPLLCPMF